MGEEAEIRRGARDIDLAREADRLARIDALGPGQGLGLPFDPFGNAQEEPRTLFYRLPRPARKRPVRRRDGGFQINRIGFRDEGIGPPRRRLDIIEVTTRGRGQKLAADIVRDGDHGRFM